MYLHNKPAQRRGYVFLAVLLGSLAGCRDSTSPADERGEPGISIVAGANVTDTVRAPLPLALRVVVRDDDGRVMPGVVVRFSAVPAVHPNGFAEPSLFVGALNAPAASTVMADTTSADGVALARIELGRVAGPGAVAITVPEAGLQDTARYTITPGEPVKVVLPAADTAVQAGRSLALGGRTEDRYGNARTDAIVYEVTGTGLALSGTQVSTSVPARGSIIARLDRPGVTRDTTWLSVVPAGIVAVPRGDKLMTVALDGTGQTLIPHTLPMGDYGPEWHPNGQSLLAVLGTWSGPRSLYRVELNGATQHIISPAASGSDDLYIVPGVIRGFSYSPDGGWVYLSGNNCNYNAILYRLPASNPQAIQRLSPAGVDECFELVNHWPSLSPDGSRLAYENQTWNESGYSIRVMTVDTRAVTQIATGGRHPRWSPAGDLIAYWASGQVWVVRPDGSGARAVSPAGRTYVPGVQWSPDGKWILARFERPAGWVGTTLALLDVSTGLELPLPWTTNYVAGLPAWRPGS